MPIYVYVYVHSYVNFIFVTYLFLKVNHMNYIKKFFFTLSSRSTGTKNQTSNQQFNFVNFTTVTSLRFFDSTKLRVDAIVSDTYISSSSSSSF